MAIGIKVPDAIDQRLDALADRLGEIGCPATRRDLVAALILNAPDTDDQLAVLLMRLRTSVVRDALLPGQKLAEPGRAKSPGPRRSRKHGAS